MLHNIFAIELCMRLEPDDRVQRELRALIDVLPASAAPGRKWGVLKRAADVLLEAQSRWVKGCWDYFDNDDRARTDYDMWCNGMITEEGARREPSGLPDADARYMTFTISLLLKAGSHSANELARLCEIPQGALWRSKSFVRILSGLHCVSYASVKSDVLYLIPRDMEWGLTETDLLDPKFHYLRPITE